jgi:hypothetical protein
MRFDRTFGDEEPFGDLGVGKAAGELDQDLALSGGELVELGAGGSSCVLRVGSWCANVSRRRRFTLGARTASPGTARWLMGLVSRWPDRRASA